MNTNNHSLRYILPFAFDAADFATQNGSLHESLCSQDISAMFPPLEGPCWELFNSASRQLLTTNVFPFIQTMFDTDAGTRCFGLRPTEAFANALFRDKKLEVWKRQQRTSILVSIADLQVYIFETGVGFLVFDFKAGHSVDTQTLASLSWMLRDFRQTDAVLDISRDPGSEAFDRPQKTNHNTTYLRRATVDTRPLGRQALKGRLSAKTPPIPGMYAWRHQEETKNIDHVSFTLRELCLMLLKKCTPLTPSLLINKYLIGYHRVLTPEYSDPRELGRDLFLLRRNYKDSYLSTDRDIGLENNLERLSTFRNIHFGISLEGGVAIIEDVDHDYVKNFASEYDNNYFFPFLIALHERFALLNYSNSVAAMDVTDIATARALRERLLTFSLRWRFSQVSNMSMVSHFYRRWRTVLGCEALLLELTHDIEELDELLEREDRKQQERRERTVVSWLNMLNLCFFPLIICISIFGINIKEIGGVGWSVYDPSSWIVLGSVFGVYIVMLIVSSCLRK
jgi:hypothetical protein